ncbi:MAG: translation elongation factor Ts, partial [Martelella sp.]
MAISAAQVKELREKTGVGFMDCKSALTEVDGDLEKAIDILRTRGQAKAAKRSGRSTGQGVVGSYIHTGGQVGVLVEVGCESDFVARTDEFQALVREIAMHIAAANPSYGTRAEVPEADVEREKSIFRAQFKDSNKPPAIVDKIVEGKLNSYYEQIVLIDQPSIR